MKPYVVSVVIFSLLLLSGCKKPGCTGSGATNYDSEAKTDDGSCQYTGQAYVHYDYTTQNNLEDAGITQMEIYVDNEFVGLQNTSAPVANLGCNSSVTVSKTFDMGNSYELVKMLTVKDQSTGLVIYTHEFTLYCNNCMAMSISY